MEAQLYPFSSQPHFQDKEADEQGGKDGNPPDLTTIFFETSKKDNKLVEPEAIEKHAQLEKTVQEDPSLSSIEIVEKCCGPPEVAPQRISYCEIQRASHGFDVNNLLGSGSFGSVYKGTVANGMTVVVKVFNVQMEGTFQTCDRKCEIFLNLRHRNLTKIISNCCNLDFKALILEYMPNKSLNN